MPKLPNTKTETPEDLESQRLTQERAREIAKTIKGMLLPGSVFVLVTAAVGDADAPNKSAAYVANTPRDNAARLLEELLDVWKHRDGLVTEPTSQTAAFMREQVKLLVDLSPKAMFRDMRKCFDEAEKAFAAGDVAGAVALVMSTATYALAMYQSFAEFNRQLERAEAEKAGVA